MMLKIIMILAALAVYSTLAQYLTGTLLPYTGYPYLSSYGAGYSPISPYSFSVPYSYYYVHPIENLFRNDRGRSSFSISADPEISMNAEQMITTKGYPYEGHTVVTDDGFILKLHRIPHGKQGSGGKAKAAVYLQHGLLCTSCDWLLNLENQSLGYILADQGFDVWIGDSRGNMYSRDHKIYTPTQSEFWAWSWDHMAKYDLPAFINYIISNTGRPQIYYVGHSQGTMMAFAGFSENAQLASKIKMFFALAPVAYLKNIKSAMRVLAPFSFLLDMLTSMLGNKEFSPSNAITQWLAMSVCPNKLLLSKCANALYLIGGPDTKNINESRVPVIYGHYPAGSSVQNIAHFSQGVVSGEFKKFDFSFFENLRVYGQIHPPAYNLNKMTVPTVIFWGEKDWLAAPEDVQTLIPKIPKLVGNHKFKDANHFDFVYGVNAAKDYYATIVDTMNQMEAHN